MQHHLLKYLKTLQITALHTTTIVKVLKYKFWILMHCSRFTWDGTLLCSLAESKHSAPYTCGIFSYWITSNTNSRHKQTSQITNNLWTKTKKNIFLRNNKNRKQTIRRTASPAYGMHDSSRSLVDWFSLSCVCCLLALVSFGFYSRRRRWGFH